MGSQFFHLTGKSAIIGGAAGSLVFSGAELVVSDYAGVVLSGETDAMEEGRRGRERGDSRGIKGGKGGRYGGEDRRQYSVKIQRRKGRG